MEFEATNKRAGVFVTNTFNEFKDRDENISWNELLAKGRWAHKLLANGASLTTSQISYTFTCSPRTYFYPMFIFAKGVTAFQANVRYTPDINNYDVYDSSVVDNYIGMLGAADNAGDRIQFNTPSLKITDAGRILIQARAVTTTGLFWAHVAGIEIDATPRLAYKTKRYVALGDSTTWTKASKFYADYIQEFCFASSAPMEVYNKGIGSTNSTKLSAILDYYLLDLDFDLVSICVGMNDCVNGTQVPVAIYQSNLQAILTKIFACRPYAEIILIAPTTTTEATRSPHIASYRTAMQSVALLFPNNVYYVSSDLAWTSSGGDMAANVDPDLIHPNTTGHLQWWNSQIKKVFQTTRTFKEAGVLFQNYLKNISLE